MSIAVVFAIPWTMNYQGKLTDPSGVGINADLDMAFRIYDVETGGTALWTETHDGLNQVEVIKGLFDVELGSITPINLDFSTDYWLDVAVNGEVLTPRIKLNSTPYSFRAAIADSVAGGGSGSSNWTLSGSYLYPNSTTYDVGIGTTSPTQKLDVASNLRLRGYLYDYNNTSGTSGQVLTRGTFGVEWQDASGGVSGSGTSNHVARWTGTSTLGTGVIYDNGTSVGIGTTSPSARLNVVSSSGTAIRADNPGGMAGLFIGEGTAIQAQADYTVSNSTAIFATGGRGASVWAEAGWNDSKAVYGYSGYGNSWGVYGEAEFGVFGKSYWGTGSQYGVAGEGRWGVKGYATSFESPRYAIYGDGTSTDAGVTWAGYFDGDVFASGNVGIGTTSPGHQLHIQNTGGASSAKIGYSSAYYDNRLYFGDGSYVYVGELNADDRLYLRGGTMSVDISGNLGGFGQVLKSNGTTLYWANDETGSGSSPSGSDGAIQYNNGGSFGGNASELYWDDSNNRLGLGTTVTTSGKLSIIHSDYTSGIWISNPGHGIEISGMGVGYDALRAQGQRYGVYATGNTNGVWGQMNASNYGFLGGTVAGNNAGMGANGEWVSGFFGDFNDSDCGERGIYSIGAVYGVFARDTCGGVTTSDNYAYLGYRETTAPNTEYGILAQGNDYAGYFIGTTYFDVGSYNWQTDYLAGEPTLHPTSADWGYIGTSTYNWWRMYANTYYGENSSIILFDTYDDLALLHAIEGDTVWDPALRHHVMQIRPETFPRCITNYEENSDELFISVQRTDGLLIGAIRQLDNEAKMRDNRLAKRTEILANAVGVDFEKEDTRLKIFDFGSSSVIAGSRWIAFSDDFANYLHGETPVVTLTAHSPDADLWVAEKSANGFLVRSKEAGDIVDFDWSAFARVNVRTSADIGDVFRTEKPDIRGSYPVHIPKMK